MTGKTATGFEFNIEADSIADDWEMVELLAEADSGDNMATIKAMKAILGKDYDRLKDHIRDESGKVSAIRMKNEFLEILSKLGGSVKN